MELTITLAGGRTLTVRPAAGDFVRFERHFDTSIAVLDDEQRVRMDHIMFLAWCALRRTGQVDVDYEAFLDQVDEMPQRGLPAPKADTPA